MRPANELRFEGVTKAFGRTRALDGVDLAVPPGSYVALMGHNGAGKTTLLRMAAGLAVPTRGRVTLAGVDQRKSGPGLRRLIGFVSHDSMLYGELTSRENLELHARLFSLPNPGAVAASVAERFDVSHVLDRPARGLSRGTRQRLTLARALLHEPQVLLLDEPFTGLDEASGDRLAGLLIQLQAEGRTVMLSTHDSARAASGPHRLLTLQAGRIVADADLRVCADVVEVGA